ncbi:ATP-dependent RNA helicase DEAH12, chloroplastic-like isoform X2 [Portunus trituberculatus]|uniref:ATP-dependent RNA helicase DEAH12, chloroplastic-like isoform X2 n=1 Tax=Portunus trituberculatus TaxID=210409 RepID=UPI001E1CE3E6|nr:ATP-dependent RNA helicase DEAH12, chloroplastic-like isoform X2 [Portunus trituberculatus]
MDGGAAIPLKTDSAAAIPLKTDSAAAIPLKTDSAAAIPLKTDSGAAIPLKTDSGAAIPLKTDSAKAIPLKTDSAAAIPLKTDSAKAIPLKTDSAAAIPLNTNSAKAIPLKTDSAPAIPLKMDGGAAIPLKEGGGAAVSGKDGGDAAVPGKEGGDAAVPGKEDGGAAVPGKEDGGAAVPGKEGGAAAVPGKEDGDAAVPGKKDGGAAVPGKEGGAAAVPGKEGGAAAVPSKEGGGAAVPGKEGGAARSNYTRKSWTKPKRKRLVVPYPLPGHGRFPRHPVNEGQFAYQLDTGMLVRPPASGISIVCCKFSEVFHNKNDISAYVSYRVSDRVMFRLKHHETDGRNTIIVLHCPNPQVAQQLRKEIQNGNAECPTQVWCFGSLAEARGEHVRPLRDLQSLYQHHLQQIEGRAMQMLASHYDKMDEVKEQLEKLRQGKRNLSLEEFAECLKSLKALEDRHQELELQKGEFQRHLEGVLTNLHNAKDTQKLDALAIELRKDMATECNRLDKAFPIYARRRDIVKTVKKNQVCIVIGETGSGKSTQMAQFFMQEDVAREGLVACTQPRKIAATSLAQHVANEMGSEVGGLVGYKVGMHTKKSESTRILYMTDHVLLNECLQDPALSRYSCVIIDEAHERSIYTDLLLGMLRSCLQTRPELRLVITSATIKPDVFVRYFGKCPVVKVSGRMFPVEVEWQEVQDGVDSFDKYQEVAVRKAVEVHCQEGEGDVLVFVTSPAETERCCQMFRNQLEGRQEDYVVQQLHGRLQNEEQQEVFQPAPEGRRKVVFATNSAETSVTIPGIKFVIDTGLVKEMKYDPMRGISSLSVTLISQSSARQRQGRAGRLGPGKCFRLYTEQDYKSMAPDALPEILKVHVGHAMLKLLELGVDPMKFEYVEAPSTEALETAIASLQALGAVVEGRITDLGRWVAKMPFDPRFGVMVHDAVQAGAGLEGIVVAATTGCGPVFYRGGSAREKEMADKRKVPFCHEGGDQLTALNVFREWHAVPERNQGRWCLTHATNGKTLRAVRETTREVLHTLDKELGVQIPFKFGEACTVDVILARLLFRTLSSNLSHYLGHPKAGYAPVFKEQRVDLHPSSVLLPLGSHPEWLVFEQVMRTSSDFAMQVTPVQECAVVQAVQDGWLQLDVETAKKKKLVVACRELVGPQLMREVVGPRYSLLRNFEEKLNAAYPGCVVVVEANTEKGELRVLSSQQQQASLTQSFKDVVPPLRAKFKDEESEESVSRSERGGVRAVMGAGGVVTNLLMPAEYTAVMVNCRLDDVQDLSEGKVAVALSKHGAIKECTKFFRKNNKSTLWGKVVFKEHKAAAAAVQESYDRQMREKQRRFQENSEDDPDEKEESDDLHLCVRPNVRTAERPDAAFTARIQWCRRPSRGFGYVSFVNVEDFMRARTECVFGGITVGESRARVKVARKEAQSLHVSNFGPLVTEDVLRAAFAEKLNLHPTRDLTKVVVVRVQKSNNPEERHTCKRRLISEIENFVPRGSFHLEVQEPRSDRDVNFLGFCKFNNPEHGHAACVAIDKKFYMMDTVVTMRPNIRSSLFVHSDVYAQCGQQLEALQHELKDGDVRLEIKKLRNNNVFVTLFSDSVAGVAHVRARLKQLVSGDVVECGNSPASVILFSYEGRNLLREVMDRTHTLVLTDTRLRTLSIHGPAEQREIARGLITDYLRMLADHRDNIQLRGASRPPGLMKALMMKYGGDLENLRTSAGLGTVTLNLRHHLLGLYGPRQAVEKARQMVEALATALPQKMTETAEEQPDCPVCLCPVESAALRRLECCGHAYCRECLTQQVSTALTSRTFPVECVQEGCGASLAWRDFINVSREGHLTLARLVQAAVAAHVQAHQQALHYCITPDCPVVYRTTKEGALFVCPDCEARACTACHVLYHEGITCAMHRSAENDGNGLNDWMRQDTGRRKVCPSCSTPIEKLDGCDKMTCEACRKVLCWQCLAVFLSEDECYKHLRNQHGGYGGH